MSLIEILERAGIDPALSSSDLLAELEHRQHRNTVVHAFLSALPCCKVNRQHAIADLEILKKFYERALIFAGLETPMQTTRTDRSARYSVVETTDDVVFIVDLDTGKHRSVTNDAELVVSEIAASNPGKRIVYRDTMQRWDELRHDGGTFTGYAPWNGPLPALTAA